MLQSCSLAHFYSQCLHRQTFLYCLPPADTRHDIRFVPRPQAKQSASKKTARSSFRRTYLDRPARDSRNTTFTQFIDTKVYPTPMRPNPRLRRSKRARSTHRRRPHCASRTGHRDESFAHKRSPTARIPASCTLDGASIFTRYDALIPVANLRREIPEALLGTGTTDGLENWFGKVKVTKATNGKRMGHHSQPVPSAGRAQALTQSSKSCLSAGSIVWPKGMKPDSTTSPIRCQRNLVI
jgi:hypothetical protein